MTFNCIIANPPYSKIGCDITKKLVNEIEYNDISILGTRALLAKHNEHLALEYVYIEGYVLNPVCKVKWVDQIILIGHTGSCTVIPYKGYNHNIEEKPNEIRIAYASVHGGQMRVSIKTILTRNRETSFMISVSDEDFSYLKEHWNDMSYVDRFWWMHDHGLYKQFITNFQGRTE